MYIGFRDLEIFVTHEDPTAESVSNNVSLFIIICDNGHEGKH